MQVRLRPLLPAALPLLVREDLSGLAMTRIEAWQDEHRVWVRHNFPDQDPYEPLLGLMEEVGELAHAHLKHKQGIRGFKGELNAMAAKIDAVGDIFVYLMSYCNANDIDLETAISETWAQVRERDWQADRLKGGQA